MQKLKQIKLKPGLEALCHLVR